MPMRAKTKIRLTVLVVVAVAIVCAVAAVVVVRKHQLYTRALAWRTQGMADASAGRNPQALDQLGRYIQRYPDDAKALYTYAIVRLRMPDSNGKQLVDAMQL